MRSIVQRGRTGAGLALAFASMFIVSSAVAQSVALGETTFENSGAAEAQEPFLTGLLYLHSFEYESAAKSFQRAQEIDPDFAMAYWGEAMAYNHPLWDQQARREAVNCLRRLGRTAEERAAKAPTQREKDYLRAAEILFGMTPESRRVPKETRDDLFRDWMKVVHERYPDDLDAGAFYALSVLGSGHEGRDYRLYMQAAAVLLPLWNITQTHPGVAHYLIHSLDDPIHAPLGLPMARAYSDIAPSAPHAQHMTSHIFLELGMWDDLVKANERSTRIRDAARAETGKQAIVSSHDHYWLMYGYLQQGRIDLARKMLDRSYARLSEHPTADERSYFAAMLARFVIDTQDWDALDRYPLDDDSPIAGYPHYVYVQGLAAWYEGERDRIADAASRLVPGGSRHDIRLSTDQVDVLKRQLTALHTYETGDADRAIEQLHTAIEREHNQPWSYGPPHVLKPTAELLGEVLLRTAQHEDAAQAFALQLTRTPGRVQTLDGLEQATRIAEARVR